MFNIFWKVFIKIQNIDVNEHGILLVLEISDMLLLFVHIDHFGQIEY